jgi:FkbM family methyltransferase
MIKHQIKKLLKSAIATTGYQIRVSPVGSNPNLATLLQQLLELYQIDTVLDVGANEGQYALWLRQVVGFRHTILSFEPVREVHAALRQKTKLDRNWHAFQIALGAASETRKINVAAKPVFSSFLAPSKQETTLYANQNVVVAQELVTIAPLADLWPEIKQQYNIRRPFLKLDTQGFDLEVLKGASSLLRQIPLLQNEMSFLALYEGMPDFGTVWTHLKEEGFELCGLYPVFHDHLGRIGEADGLFLNRIWHGVRRNKD